MGSYVPLYPYCQQPQPVVRVSELGPLFTWSGLWGPSWVSMPQSRVSVPTGMEAAVWPALIQCPSKSQLRGRCL